MSLSYATVTPSKMELTPQKVLFKPTGALTYTDLGGTLSNVVIETKFEKAEIKADQLGTSPLDRRVKGMMVTVTTELTEVLNMETVNIVFPGARIAGTTTKTLHFESNIGASDLSKAGTLILHPLSFASTDYNADYTFPIACSSEESSITYGPDNQARLKIVWNIYMDTSETPPYLYSYGDPANV